MVGALNKLPIAVFGMLFFVDAVVNFASVSSIIVGKENLFFNDYSFCCRIFILLYQGIFGSKVSVTNVFSSP